MRPKFLPVIILAFLCLAQIAQAQTKADCDALFEKAIDKTRSLRMLSKNSAFEMIARATLTPEKGAVVHERMEVVALGDRYKYVTAQHSLYQDARTMVVVQREQKSVFLTRPTSETMRQNQFGEMMKLQDSLRKYLVVRECTREFGTIEPNAGYTRIVLAPADKLAGQGLKTISYWVDAASADVKKIMIEYTPGSLYGMKRYELVIEKMNARSTTSPFSGEALAQVMQKGKLRNEFTGYQVIDKRN